MTIVSRALAACVLLVPCVTGCFGRTHAEDPLPGPVQEAAVVADAGTEMRRFIGTAYLPVPPWEAWDWFASEDRLEAWLARDVTLDAIAGGPVVLASDEGVATGSVTDVDEPRSMTWTFDGQKSAEGASTTRTVTFIVTGEIGGSRLRVEEAPFDATRAGEMLAIAHRQRWSESLRVLRAAVMRGLPTVPQELSLQATVPAQAPAPTPLLTPTPTPAAKPTETPTSTPAPTQPEKP